MERKWVIAAFLDLTNSRTWFYRAATSHEEKEAFVKTFYTILQDYVRERTDCWSKYEGDALLTLKEFTPAERKDPKKIAAFFLDLRGLFGKVITLIRESESAPEDARIRIIDGYAYKVMVLDPNDPERKRMIPEYVEYGLNSLKGYLGVNPDTHCLATESVCKKMGNAGSVFRMRPNGTPSCYPKGVNREDVDALRILRFS